MDAKDITSTFDPPHLTTESPGRGKNTTLRSVQPGNGQKALNRFQPANGAVPQRERAENAERVMSPE